MKNFSCKPIGIIRSPFKTVDAMPIQPAGAKDIEGRIEIFPDYVQGIKDLSQFSHLILIYYFHLSKGYDLLVKPFLDDETHGVFACRAPRRPNPIGISVVRLKNIKGSILHISDLDIVDATPLLDIKPYVSKFDKPKDVNIGWYKKKITAVKDKQADSRFKNVK